MFLAVNIDDWKPIKDKQEEILLAMRYLLQTVEETPNKMLCLNLEGDHDEDVHSVVIVVNGNAEAAQKLSLTFEAVQNGIINIEEEKAGQTDD